MSEAHRPLSAHPVRAALLELIGREGAVTATDAARELGGNTGLYSFHLRRLAEAGLVEEVPTSGGRAKPWRLAGDTPPEAPPEVPRAPSDAELAFIARGLEDESYRQWLERRDEAPAEWRHDEAFSQAAYLTPEEMAGVADVVRAVIAQFRHRDTDPSSRPADAKPVAIMARLFPLL
ncbi:winged helix-turn-helix domain-containing protein [Actinocorallia populi]|uniref:winged helix-turn-helix domain-containing protein n=1 Tax=Actinocorallia populi TaxID=2079200 RepID=UPI001E5F787A|nr:helix-turn-helix domain-containing protein [Actinocorallia populi]